MVSAEREIGIICGDLVIAPSENITLCLISMAGLHISVVCVFFLFVCLYVCLFFGGVVCFFWGCFFV